MNQTDGSVLMTDSHMITPVVRDWHRLSTQEQNLAYSHFMRQIFKNNISKSLAYTYRARRGVGGPLTRRSAIAGLNSCLRLNHVRSVL